MGEITPEETNFYLTNEAKSFLRETAKWSYFLSIIGFIGIGFIVMLAFFMGTICSMLGSFGGVAPGMAGIGALGGFLTTIYLIIALIYFFPVYYLYQFASKAKAAFATNNNEQLNASFEYLKSHYKFIGIFTIALLGFYVLTFAFVIKLFFSSGM